MLRCYFPKLQSNGIKYFKQRRAGLLNLLAHRFVVNYSCRAKDMLSLVLQEVAGVYVAQRDHFNYLLHTCKIQSNLIKVLI